MDRQDTANISKVLENDKENLYNLTHLTSRRIVPESKEISLSDITNSVKYTENTTRIKRLKASPRPNLYASRNRKQKIPEDVTMNLVPGTRYNKAKRIIYSHKRTQD